MHTRTRWLAAAAALALSAGRATAADQSATPNQMEKHFTLIRTQRVEINYLLFLPKGYDESAAKRWPLILFLHGAGERGTNLSRVAIHGPPKNVKQDPDFPFVVVSPQCPDHQTWSTDALLALLDDVLKRFAVDPGRVYLTGLSMGGYGSWDLGLRYPEKFAAIAPICGGGQLIHALLSGQDKAQALRSLGVWAFHGAKDPVVPVAESERMVDVLKRAGISDVKLTIYPEANHDSWTETYLNPELYKWFLAHERKPAASAARPRTVSEARARAVRQRDSQ